MNIHQKLFHVQQSLTELLRTERNKFQNYWFFNEEQILTKLRPLLEKNKLLLLFSDDSEKFEYHSQEKTYEVKYLKRIVIVDIEDEKDTLTFSFWACANNQDLAKAKGSAETYAIKYFLSKFFLVPIKDNLDPDNLS